MKNPGEIALFLSKEEFDLFGKFLSSPVFNTSDRLLKFYSFLKKNYKKASAGELLHHDIKRNFFKAEKLEDESKAELNTRKLISDFNKNFEMFLAFLEFKSSEVNQRILLLRSLRERGFNKRFESLCKELEEYFALNKVKSKTGYYYHKKFLEEVRLYKLATDLHSSSESIRKYSGALDLYFISEKIEIFQNMFSLEYLSKKSRHEWSYFNEISKFIQDNIDHIKESEPLIYMNYMTLKLLNSSDKDIYFELKKFLEKNLQVIDPEILKHFVYDLMNCCYLKVNEGASHFRKEIHFLLALADEKNLLLDNGKINHAYFKAGVDNSLSLREFDWLEKFIKKYSGHIEPEYRENLTNLAYTKLYLYKGEYDKARIFENKIGYKDYIHYLDAKLTLARIEYESCSTDSVLAIFDSVKKYLSKHSNISEYYNFFYCNFIFLMTKLLKAKERSFEGKDTEYELHQLNEEIKKEKRSFYGKLWVQEKISLLQMEKPELRF